MVLYIFWTELRAGLQMDLLVRLATGAQGSRLSALSCLGYLEYTPAAATTSGSSSSLSTAIIHLSRLLHHSNHTYMVCQLTIGRSTSCLLIQERVSKRRFPRGCSEPRFAESGSRSHP
mmetsp:Transcript_16338/g.22833  ORF Transcript_16338/g.22833 Transcript_16338/m.22833 type:complete len:118 (+) Transcript_16338:402-755(+)